MANIELTKSFPGTPPERVFQAVASSLPEAGFEIWKTRPIAYLVMANRQTAEGKVQATVSIRPGAGSDLTLSIVGEVANKEALLALGKTFLHILEDHLE